MSTPRFVRKSRMNAYPTSKARQVAAILKSQIEAGMYSQRLPGERKLAADLLISRGCLREALEELSQMGCLSAAEPSKRRQILRPASHPKRQKKVIFLTPEMEHRAPATVLVQVAKLRKLLAASEIPVEMLSSPVFNHPKANPETLATLIDDHPASHWVLHQCPRHIQNFFAERPISCTVLGSVFNGLSLASIDIDFRSVARHATAHLIAKGHHRIALIRFRSELAGDEQSLEGMQTALQAHPDLPPPRVLTHNFHVDRLTASLDRLLSSQSPPTALLVPNVPHYLTVHSHLQARGLRLPQDISLIALSHDSSLDRLRPAPFCYRLGDALIESLAKSLLTNSPRARRDSKRLIPEPCYGDTAGPVPRTRF